jgi:predicted Zn-dependent protease
LAAAAVALSAVTVGAQQSDSILWRAMRDELERSMRELPSAKLDRPYFISYRISEQSYLSAYASNGGLVRSDESRVRSLAVQVRVGDYAFDNTNAPSSGGFGIMMSFGGVEMGPMRGELPLDDNYLEIRRALWLATDGLYKQAVEMLAAKKSALLNRARLDSLPDFSKETPTQTVDDAGAAKMDLRNAEALARELSGLREMKALNSSSAGLTLSNSRVLYLNSEGTSYTKVRPSVTVNISASTQAADGQRLSGSLSVRGRSAEALPARDQLVEATRAMALRIDSLTHAPFLERYSGPVLFQGIAAAEVLRESFAPSLTGRRRVRTGEASFGGGFGRRGARDESFTDRIGSRVLPDFLTVIDDPTLNSSPSRTLSATYKVDDEGVPGRRQVLVDAGIVKGVLTTRNPIEQTGRSTGNARGGGAFPSNLLIESSKAESESALKARLLELVKKRGLSFGIIVRELGGAMPASREDVMEMMSASRGAGRGVFRAYKVFLDGHEELVRGARLADLSAQSFKDIVAVSDSSIVYTASAVGGDSPFDDMPFGGSAIATYVVPSLLFEDMTLTKVTGSWSKPPLSAAPR